MRNELKIDRRVKIPSERSTTYMARLGELMPYVAAGG